MRPATAAASSASRTGVESHYCSRVPGEVQRAPQNDADFGMGTLSAVGYEPKRAQPVSKASSGIR
jgi:hypothetical protein